MTKTPNNGSGDQQITDTTYPAIDPDEVDSEALRGRITGIRDTEVESHELITTTASLADLCQEDETGPP